MRRRIMLSDLLPQARGGFEPPSLDSKSRVLTVTPSGRKNVTEEVNICDWDSQSSIALTRVVFCCGALIFTLTKKAR